MNKMLMVVVVAASLISGCSDKEDAASGQAGPSAIEKAMESTKGAMSDIGDAVSESADKAMDSAGEMVSDAKHAVSESAGKAMDSASEMASDTAEKVAALTDSGVDGQPVYQKACQSCHAAGVAGAPKLGDKAAWAPRIATGMDALLASSINGKGIMPPRGACASCSDDELKAAVEYMVSQSK